MSSAEDPDGPEEFDPYAQLRHHPPGFSGFGSWRKRARKRTPVTKAKAVVAFLVFAMIFYFVIIGYRAFSLFGDGGARNIVLGAAVLVLPFVGVWVVIAELRFGVATEVLAERLDAEGAEPEPELPLTPSGRIQREAADALFAQRRAAVEAAPDDWQGWYRLSLAYDYSGDRRRAREAMRTAIDKADLPRAT